MSDTYKDHGHPPGWENEHDPRCQACALSELASSGCSAQVDLPARLLRLVVQVEDTPENRKALLAVRETAMTRSFTAGHSVVKLEHVIVVGCDALNG